MREIKFRGIAENGEQIFSNSIQFDEDGRSRKFCSLKDEFGNWIFVDPETVAQLVGYDKNENEVYSDDFLDDDGFMISIDSKISEFEEYIADYKLDK